jgi:hypothetical protein
MAEFTGKPQEIIQWLFSQDREKTFTVKERKKKRSLTQNAYYWVLNDKLSAALRMSREETHRHLLCSYAPCVVMTLLKAVPLGDYFDYYEVFAEGKMNGKEYNHVRIYKGSSKMDSTEFARLLDGTIQECEQQGIQTLTPREIAELKFIEPKED